MTAPDADKYDVIVVGYGYAGAVSAIHAARAGGRVLLLEKAAHPGGISICSAGGLRTAQDADAAFAYLKASNAGKTPDDVLRQLAGGMTGLTAQLKTLATGIDASVENRPSPANYPFEGNDTFGFCYVTAIAGFDPDKAWPHVRGAKQGALLFRLLQLNVMALRDTIDIRLNAPVKHLVQNHGSIEGIQLETGDVIKANRGVILACGGFEANPHMQAQYWPGGPARSAAYAHNTGDGIRMAQAVGADLWHMWHWHGCYGYDLGRDDYPFGVRIKRLPDWTPDADGQAPDGLPVMPWILLDQGGYRFMNEYEPYVQDTGGRALASFDPAHQRHDRNPAWMVTDKAGLAMYPLGKPTHNYAHARYDWSPNNAAEVASELFRQAPNCTVLAAQLQADEAVVVQSLSDWNADCSLGRDTRFERPKSSLHHLRPPYYVAQVSPVVSNTQGGPVHDAHQHILTPFGRPIPGLFAAGECGSAFGHLYMSGGNLAECFIGGKIAGENAVRRRQE